jgi:hypothetical protein
MAGAVKKIFKQSGASDRLIPTRGAAFLMLRGLNLAARRVPATAECGHVTCSQKEMLRFNLLRSVQMRTKGKRRILKRYFFRQFASLLLNVVILQHKKTKKGELNQHDEVTGVIGTGLD